MLFVVALIVAALWIIWARLGVVADAVETLRERIDERPERERGARLIDRRGDEVLHE